MVNSETGERRGHEPAAPWPYGGTRRFPFSALLFPDSLYVQLLLSRGALLAFWVIRE